jgi:hypothetical protein
MKATAKFLREITCKKSGYTYELHIEEVDANIHDCMTRPLSNDVLLYAIYYDHCKSVYLNDDCVLGCFYIPFVKCNDASELQLKISDLLQEIRLLVTPNKKDLAVHVYKTKDIHGNKYAAICAVNRYPKSESIKKLNVRTSYLDVQEIYALESWIACLDEIDCEPDKTEITQIECEEILEFEDRRFLVDHLYSIYKAKDIVENYDQRYYLFGQPNVLLLSSVCDDFYATHMARGSSYGSWDFKIGKMRSIYRTRIYRMTSMEEIYSNVKKMIQTFRDLTGYTKCKTCVKYHEFSHNIFDVSIITFAVDIKSENKTEETESF